MLRATALVFAWRLGVAALPARTAPAQRDLPHLRKSGAVTQLTVDGRPFLTLAGQLHNSSASSAGYMAPIWPKLAATGAFAIQGPVQRLRSAIQAHGVPSRRIVESKRPAHASEIV